MRLSLFASLVALWRLVAVFAATFYDYSMYLLGSWVFARSPRRRAAWQERRRRLWGAHLVRLLNVRWRVDGVPPEPPFLLVANHLSYIDIPVLMKAAGGVFVAKADLSGWPLLGPVVAGSGTLLIDRGTKRDLLRVGELIERHLAAGGGVVVFLEGTTGAGDALLPFKPSLLEVAARSGRPVHYATLTYATPEGSPPPVESVCWWGDAEFMPHVRELVRLPWFAATVSFGAEPVTGADRKQLAARLRTAMEALFEPCA